MSLNPINTTPQNRVPQTPRPSSVGETRPEESTIHRTRQNQTHINNLINQVQGITTNAILNKKQLDINQ